MNYHFIKELTKSIASRVTGDKVLVAKKNLYAGQNWAETF